MRLSSNVNFGSDRILLRARRVNGNDVFITSRAARGRLSLVRKAVLMRPALR